MANVFSNVADLEKAVYTNGGGSRPNARDYGGVSSSKKVSKTGYTAATADPLYLTIIPKGSMLNLSKSSVRYGDPGDAATCKLGLFTTAETPVEIDDDAYGSGLALGGSAGRKVLDETTTLGDYFTTPTRLTQDAWLVATWTTVTNGASHDQYWDLCIEN
jgi:hypothetical protein